MKKNNVVIVVIFLFLTSVANAEEFNGWRKLPVSLAHTEINSIRFDQSDQGKFFLSTMSGIYTVRFDEGKNIEIPVRILRSPVNTLLIDEAGLYAAGDHGLFISKDGKTWRNDFTNGGPSGLIWDVLKKTNQLYMATNNGLYIRKDTESVWRQMEGEPGSEAVYRLLNAPDGIYALTRNKVFLISDDQKSMKCLYFVSSSGSEEELAEDANPEDETYVFDRSIIDLECRGQILYLGTRKGVYKSVDHGRQWDRLSIEGFPSFDLTSLTIVSGRDGEDLLCAGTLKGAYCFLKGRWLPLYDGLDTNNVIALESNSRGDLIAATDGGLYVMRSVTIEKLAGAAHTVLDEGCRFKEYMQIDNAFAYEPTIQDVHTMAIRYADVDKAKIDSWHRQSRFKTLLPSVSVGADRSATDMFHWDSGPNPDILSKGREYIDWDVSVSWELSDLIWSSSQTSIDSRSKMMTELRVELLDQITRIYFERRRIQIELMSCSYPSTGDRMAADMRVHELTALIDAYTGGQFSKKIHQQLNQQPRRVQR